MDFETAPVGTWDALARYMRLMDRLLGMEAMSIEDQSKLSLDLSDARAALHDVLARWDGAAP